MGIDGPKDEIIERLMDKSRGSASSEDVMTVCIVGCGGSGKTTLANQIYCKIKGEFQRAAFVSVFQNPNIKKVLVSILSQVGADSCALDDEQQIINNLREYLSDKRYLGFPFSYIMPPRLFRSLFHTAKRQFAKNLSLPL